jgi:hypothetical protein
MAAFRETTQRVNIEFLRASASGAGRIIRFNHSPEIVPPQLIGRLSHLDWRAFMADVDLLAKHHPYVQKPGAKQAAGWAACFAIGSVVGLFCVNPDAGDYGGWSQEVHAVLNKHRHTFEQAGCSLSLQGGRDHWIQIDIDPLKVPSMPVPSVMPPTGVAGKPGQPPPSPFASAY